MTETVRRFQVVPAVYIFFRRDDEVLLQLRRGTGFMDEHWAAGAAGHVEAGESVFEAACREALEELGLVIDPVDLTAIATLHRTRGNHRPVDERVDFFFECRSFQGEPALQEADKAADLAWFSLDALPVPVVPHELVVLTSMRDGDTDPIIAFGF